IRRRRRKAVRGHDECAGQAPPYREGLSGLGRRIEACPHGVAGASLCLGPCPAAHWRSRSIAMMALTNISRNRRSDLLCLIFLSVSGTQAADLPHFRAGNGAVQLLVHGKPFLIRGGELGNSSAGMAMQADTTLPAMARLHLNTVLVPVAWEQVEPKEGVLDFSILDHWIDIARQQHLHLVLLWFGAWKNAFSEYAPDWVKADMKRFPRAQSAHGMPTEILSTFGTETLRADSRAFRSLMAHLREKDQEQQTVLMVQVENEMGYLGPGRDRSPEADRGFAGPVPQELMGALAARRTELSPELAAHFDPQGRVWREVFGDAAGEGFMAWRYAIFVNSVAEAGKREYPLPMYVNAQLPSLMERPGEYPSGGPHPYYLAIYRAMAPAIDSYSPDIYWPEFEYWVKRYQISGNPIFIPEAKMDSAPWNALYAYGAAKAIGFCPGNHAGLRGRLQRQLQRTRPVETRSAACLRRLSEASPWTSPAITRPRTHIRPMLLTGSRAGCSHEAPALGRVSVLRHGKHVLQAGDGRVNLH